MSGMGFWELLQTVIDDRDTTEAKILKRAGLGKGTFSAWRARGIPTLPRKEQILSLAEAMRIPPGEVVAAILVTAGFVITDDGRMSSPHGTLSKFSADPVSADADTPDVSDLRAAAKEEGIEGAGEDSI